MSKEITLKVEPREVGKGHSRRARRMNYVPAIVYGSGVKNMPVCLDRRLLEKYSGHEFENHIFVLNSSSNDLNSKHVLIKKIERDPVSRKPIHVDFYATSKTTKVKVSVELKFEGKAKGEASGGQLEIQTRNLEVECLPSDIPTHLVVDITPLDIGNTIHVSDIEAPEGVKFTTTENIAVCSVKQIKESEIPKQEEAADETIEDKKEDEQPADTGDKKS